MMATLAMALRRGNDDDARDAPATLGEAAGGNGDGDKKRSGLAARPRWQRWQIAAAGAIFTIGVTLYVIDALDVILFARPIDFGYLPLGLILVGIYVLFGIDAISAFKGSK